MRKTNQPKPVPQEPPRKGRGGPPLGSQNGRKHGHYLRKAAAKDMGWACFIEQQDKRLAFWKEYFEKQERIYTDLGGEQALSEIKQDQIDNRMALYSLVQSNLAFIFGPRSNGPIDLRTRRLRPLVHETVRLMEAMLKIDQAIGLERREKPVPTLQEYLASDQFQKDCEPDEPAPDEVKEP
jgi:hypothetical protein